MGRELSETEIDVIAGLKRALTRHFGSKAGVTKNIVESYLDRCKISNYWHELGPMRGGFQRYDGNADTKRNLVNLAIAELVEEGRAATSEDTKFHYERLYLFASLRQRDFESISSQWKKETRRKHLARAVENQQEYRERASGEATAQPAVVLARGKIQRLIQSVSSKNNLLSRLETAEYTEQLALLPKEELAALATDLLQQERTRNLFHLSYEHTKLFRERTSRTDFEEETLDTILHLPRLEIGPRLILKYPYIPSEKVVNLRVKLDTLWKKLESALDEELVARTEQEQVVAGRLVQMLEHPLAL